MVTEKFEHFEEEQAVLRPVDLAWMAGILDVRGRIYTKANKLRRTRQITLAVDSTQIPIVARLSGMTGTKPELRPVKFKEFTRRNCIEHCPDAHVHTIEGGEGAAPMGGRWTVTGAAMDVVLSNVMELVSINVAEYQLHIEEIRNGVTVSGRGASAVIDSLRRLYYLGWNIPDFYTDALLRNNVGPLMLPAVPAA